MPYIEDSILHWGRGAFLLHDAGGWIAWDQVIRVSGAWPTWRTFHCRRS